MHIDHQGMKVALRDVCLIGLAVLVVSLLPYHPYFFGDELLPFNFGERLGNGVLSVYKGLNSYKPRLVMNIFWAFVVGDSWPRWVAMLFNAACIAASASLAYALCVRRFSTGRLTALLVAALVIGSRYDVMLYWDYVSGTVETLSLALFLAGIYCGSDLFEAGRQPRPRMLAAAFAFFLLCVFVHERYAVGVLGFAGAVAVFQLKALTQKKLTHPMLFAILIAVVPLGLFACMVKLLSDNPITMGSTGRVVTLNVETFKVALTYLGNLFVGTNYGPPWFVGVVNQEVLVHSKRFWLLVAAFVICWIAPWIFQRKKMLASPRAPVIFLATLLGFVCIASLPGADRQEARWMYPAFVMMLLLVVATYPARARLVLLLLLAVQQVAFVGFGGIATISSISGSRTARSLAESFSHVRPAQGEGVLIGVPEPDTGWILGGDGALFCRINLGGQNCLHRARSYSGEPFAGYSFGLVATTIDRTNPSYRLVGRPMAELLLNEKPFPAQGDVLGEGAEWKGWAWSDPTMVGPEGVKLSRLADNFMNVAAARVDGRLLIYRARATEGDQVPMRLQINWSDASGKFLGAQIVVVSITPEFTEHALFAAAPPGSAIGAVYATLHDGAKGSVLLESVRAAGDIDLHSSEASDSAAE
ncbi:MULTISPECIES: hypothetical protein [Dyella]|uniref:Glycosyltransferase RgtA/B/C/D-like domain-containing protein n=2 Tax=Dyella TaxID=231454 RepID=A0A4R0Z1C5_9GAMM|nr:MULTISPECIES: hypothetical protein [Dyella]TBR40358.1 hypothetical protein EYV96_09405 [Dyella terrae]TCI12060.1 hypothetical protein EZM97_01465 [Dyella soli]